MKLVDFIFPKQCLICSKVGEEICDRCIKRIPHTLPSCCICRKLSNMNRTHTKCSDIHIQYYAGWYLTKEIESRLNKRKENNLYSVYEYLIIKLIKYLNIENLIVNSKVSPILTNKKDVNQLNSFLSNSIERNKRLNSNIVFVGEYLTDVQKLVEKTKGLHMTEPFYIHILVLFEPIPTF